MVTDTIILKQYPTQIIPGKEYSFKWLVDINSLQSQDDLRIFDLTAKHCKVKNIVYSNMHFNLLEPYNIEVILSKNITSKLVSNIEIDITWMLVFIILPVAFRRIVLKYVIKEGILVFDSISDTLSCMNEPSSDVPWGAIIPSFG